MKLLKFYADWCGPCKSQSMIMEGMDLGVEVDNVNIDERSEVAIQYKVRGVPTMILVDDQGVEIKRNVGVLNADALLEFVK